MGRLIRKIELDSDTMNLSEHTDGFWLWDDTRKMNLSMKAKNEQLAFVETIEYYQKRLQEVEKENKEMCGKVEKVLGILAPEMEDSL